MDSSSATQTALSLKKDETLSRQVTFAFQVEESMMDTDSFEESLIDEHCHGGMCDSESDGSGSNSRMEDCNKRMVTDEFANSVNGINEQTSLIV